MVSFTFYYILAQTVAVVSIIFLSLLLTVSNDKPFTNSLILTNTGNIHFNNEQVSYQLLSDSRLSFIGCWLVMIKDVPLLSPRINVSETIPKLVFIFRDSINKQDYSRIARVIKQLE
ncbi:hypothetical protein CXF71_18330 [Colwellia sp. 12G3]|nr:hypothetical protein CXF71_18330 [Colwellia sp. 12G3]